MGKCTATSKSGKSCSAMSIKGTTRCLFHSKAKSVNWMRSRKTKKSRK